MKRYWLFNFDRFYPSGGMQDFWGDFDTIEECHEAYNNAPKYFYHIFDSLEKKVVFTSDLMDKYDVYGSEELGDEYGIPDKRLQKIFPEELWNKK